MMGQTHGKNDPDVWWELPGFVSTFLLAGFCVYVWWAMFPGGLRYVQDPFHEAPALVVAAKAALILRVPLLVVGLALGAYDIVRAAREGIHGLPKGLAYFCLVLTPPTFLVLGFGVYGVRFHIPPGW